MMTSCRPAA